MWILIVYFIVGTGGYQSGYAVNFQEFTTKEKCESALLVIHNKTDKYEIVGWGKNGPKYHTIDGNCVEK